MPTAGARVRQALRCLRGSQRLRRTAHGQGSPRPSWLGALAVIPLVLSSSGVSAVEVRPWPSGPAEVLVGAGDIAYCNWDGDDRTAALLDTIEGTVFTIGDNSQNEGTHQQFRDCYDPSWGRHRWRTRPAIGNHDRLTADGAGYFDYFGEAAGPWGRGYYSYDLGAWHIVVLDSNCDLVGGCEAGSAQERWLRDDLAANPAQCTLAIWHHPLYNSGEVGNHPEMRDMWLALMEARADVVLSGHDHHYERFARQDADGRPTAQGIRQFLVGTGGATFHRLGTRQPNSELYQPNTLGLLKLELRADSFTWHFISTPGYSFSDSGWEACT
jgi:acid phosphatase type 7